MGIPREGGDAVLLPGGDVLIVNGAQTGCSGGVDGARRNLYPAFWPLLYQPDRPANERYTVLKATGIARMYVPWLCASCVSRRTCCALPSVPAEQCGAVRCGCTAYPPEPVLLRAPSGPSLNGAQGANDCLTTCRYHSTAVLSTTGTVGGGVHRSTLLRCFSMIAVLLLPGAPSMGPLSDRLSTHGWAHQLLAHACPVAR
jgi:hypothetical protein